MAGQTNEQTKGKIGLLSQWTMEGWDEQKWFNWNFGQSFDAFSIRPSCTRNRFSRSSCRLSNNLRQLEDWTLGVRAFGAQTWSTFSFGVVCLQTALSPILFYMYIDNAGLFQASSQHNGTRWWDSELGWNKFLDALASLKIMFKIKWFSNSCFQDFDKDKNRVLLCITECYSVLQSVKEH